MSGTMGATSTPPTPAMTVLSAQFTSAMRCGERPVTKAPFSDLGRRPGRQAEAREPEPEPQRDGERDDDRRRPQAVARHPAAEHLVGVRREDRRDGDRGRAELRGQQRLQHDHDPDRGDRLRRGRRRPQRAEDQRVQQRSEQAGHGQRDQEGGPEAQRAGPEADGRAEAGDGVDQFTHAKVGIGVGDVEGDRGGREVHHAGTPVGDHQAQRQGRVHGTAAEPEDQEQNDSAHVGDRPLTSTGDC